LHLVLGLTVGPQRGVSGIRNVMRHWVPFEVT